MAPSLSVSVLPAELLAQVLAILTPGERLGSAALVCKSWHAACHSPAFLAAVHLDTHVDEQSEASWKQAERRLAGCARWLNRHAPCVCHLHLAVRSDSLRPSRDVSPLQHLLADCVASCAGVGRALHSLSLCLRLGGLRVPAQPLLQLATSLGQLSVLCSETVEDDSALDLLTALHSLTLLSARPSRQPLGAGAKLPASLTRLCLGRADHPGPRHHVAHLRIPSQVGNLGSSLRSLELQGYGYPLASAGCEAVAQLTGLQTLIVRLFNNLPAPLVAALPALQGLQDLQLVSLRGEGEFRAAGHPRPPPGAPRLGLGEALCQLAGLTRLVIHDVVAQQLYDHPPPAQLTALTSLRHLHYAVYAGGECPGGLPPGAWLRGLRRLALEERLLHASAAALEGMGGGGGGSDEEVEAGVGAPALEQLAIKWVPYPDVRTAVGRDFAAPKWAWFWRWAEARGSSTPRLQALLFDWGGEDSGAPAPAGWQAARAALRGRRSEMAVDVCDFAGLLPTNTA